MDDFLEILTLVIIFVVIVSVISGFRKAKQSNTSGQGNTPATPSAGTTIVDGDRQKLVEDMKAMQTSRIVDQVAILDDLGQTTQNYRQFCELVGVTQQSGGVTAPYSKRQVAYYDVRCYKIERVNGREIETLVAQERSIEPFYFTDGSCDTKVYVALDTFGKNVVLVNSMNHIEGPSSDFSKAISNRTASISGTGAAKLMVAKAPEQLQRNLHNAWSWIVLTPERARMAMDAAFGFCGLRMQPALAATGATAMMQPSWESSPSARGAYFAKPSNSKPSRPPQGGFGGGRPTQQHPIGSGKPQQHSTNVSLGNSKPQQGYSVNMGSGKIPTGLDSFLGLGGSGMGGLQQNPYLGGPMSPYYGGFGTSSGKGDLGTALLNIGLSALLASMNSSSSQSSAPHPTTTTTSAPTAYTQTNNTFQGYRIVEDVVPLNYPIYCLGDIYRNANEVYMGKAMGSVSKSYYFATKLEAEVIAHLQL